MSAAASKLSHGNLDPATQRALADIGARLDRLPSSRPIWLIVAMIAIGGFFEYFEMFATSYILPGMVHSGLLSATTRSPFDIHGAGFFIASQFAGLFVGTLFLGRISDYLGRRTTFLGAMIFYAVTSVVVSFQTSAEGLHLWRFITGVGLGIQMVNISTYVTEIVPKQIRGRAFGVTMFIQMIGVPAVAAASVLLVPHHPLGIDGWRWVVAAGASGLIPFLFIRKRVPESPRWLALKGRTGEAEAIVSAIEQEVERRTGKPLPQPRPEVAAVAGGTRPRLSELFSAEYRKRTLMLIAFHICHTVGIYGFQNWGATFLLQQGISLTSSLLYSMIIACATPLGALLSISFADRWERKWQISMSAVTLAAAGLVYANSRAPALIIASGIVVTMSAAILVGAFNAYQAEVFPTRMRAMAVGFVYSWGRLGGIINGFLIAYTLAQFGVNGVFVLIAGCMLAIVVIMALFGPSTRNRSLEGISR